MPSTAAPGRRSATPLAAAIASVAMAAAACGSIAPSGAPMPPGTAAPTTAGPTATPRPAAEVYAEIRAAVAQIRGLQPTKAVEPVTLDEDQLRTNLTAEFDRENSAAELRVAEDLLVTLGLLPQGSDLRGIMLDFQSGQVAGYYSPERDQLFVVSRFGAPGPAELVTYAHEFTHQLQDQRLDLEALGLDVADQSDRQIARLALVEGDATSVQTGWMTSNLTPEQLGRLLAEALDPDAVEALTRAPAFVRETSLFPYEHGFAFASQLLAQGGYEAIDAAFADPPNSTEQILHPEKYLAREEPVAVTIPGGVATALGVGWAAAGQDTLGELILGIWLRAGSVAGADARAAAEGWAGDRVVILRGPGGAVGVGIVTTWDSAADAAEFAAAASTAVASLDAGGLVASDGLRRVVVAMGDGARAILAALEG